MKLNDELDKHYRLMYSPTQIPHCFIDKETGYIYEQNGMEEYREEPKYNLLNESSRKKVLVICDYGGSYLFYRFMGVIKQ